MELISLINTESAELSRMVEDLLTIARDDAGEIAYNTTEFALSEEIETVVRPLVRAGLAIELACPPLLVNADQLRVRQVLRNLLSNAQKWGGENVYVTCHRGDGLAVITVADNGKGVPPEIEHRLFDRYMHEGNVALTIGTVGMGLAVVKILATGMGGDIRYERDDGWTRFVLSIPVAGGPTPVETTLLREDQPVEAL